MSVQVFTARLADKPSMNFIWHQNVQNTGKD